MIDLIECTEEIISKYDTLPESTNSTIYYSLSKEGIGVPIYVSVEESGECKISFKDREDLHRILINFYPYGVAVLFKRDQALPEELTDEVIKTQFITRLGELAGVTEPNISLKNLVGYINGRGFTFFIDRKNNIILFYSRNFIFKNLTGKQIFSSFCSYIEEIFPDD